MVTVAAPTLVLLGVEPLVAHFFVFYYGVLADITPPVALAAYAAAGMAGSDPFKTGNMAFRLGLAKVLVPFVFVFSPSLLLVAKGFTLYDFAITFVGCVIGITLLAAALSKYLWSELQRWEQLLLVAGALLLVAPGLVSGLIGLAVGVTGAAAPMGRSAHAQRRRSRPRPSMSMAARAAGHGVGQHARAAAGQRPAAGAVAEVDPHAGQAAGADDRRAIGQHRARAFPALHLGLHRAAGEPVVEHLVQRGQGLLRCAPAACRRARRCRPRARVCPGG